MSGEEQLDSIWREAWRPPDRRPVWEWAEEHIRAIPYSPLPGRFRIENSPMLAEVMDQIVNPRSRVVSIMASVQSSKSTAAEVALCYLIPNMPGPTLWLDQTDDDAKDQSEGRLQKLFDECDPVRALFPANPNKKRNATIHFSNGMTLWLAGAHNKSNLQRRSIRWLFGDETWRWPVGHMAEAEARVTAFGWLGKCIFCSQAGVEGDDTHRKFLTTDQREWEFRCPHCGKVQPFLWQQVRWDKDCLDDKGDFAYQRVRESVRLVCAGCGHEFRDTDETRRRLNASACFVPLNPHASKENVGFHWNAIATMSWGALAELYLRAKAAAKKGDDSLLRQFYQKRLAIPWNEFTEDFTIEQSLADYFMDEPWEQEADINGVPLRILTVDVQKDHFYAVVRSWAEGGSSRLLHCEKVFSWEALDGLRQLHGVNDRLVFIDCGYSTYDVYAKCAEHGWNALKGDRRSTYAHRGRNGQPVQRYYSPKRAVSVGYGRTAAMYYWSNLNIKDCLARLRSSKDGATWEIPRDVPQDYLDMLDSERRVFERGKWVWKQIQNRPNHFFDCEAMQVCAATMLKLVGREAEGGNAPGNPNDSPKGDSLNAARV